MRANACMTKMAPIQMWFQKTMIREQLAASEEDAYLKVDQKTHPASSVGL